MNLRDRHNAHHGLAEDDMTVLIQTDHVSIVIGELRHHAIVVLRVPLAKQLIKHDAIPVLRRHKQRSLGTVILKQTIGRKQSRALIADILSVLPCTISTGAALTLAVLSLYAKRLSNTGMDC